MNLTLEHLCRNQLYKWVDLLRGANFISPDFRLTERLEQVCCVFHLILCFI